MRLAKSFLELRTRLLLDDSDLPKSFRHGLATTKWPGRCQKIVDPTRTGVTWYLDGAHTVESLECCMQWFVSPGVGLVPLPVIEEKYIYDHRMIPAGVADITLFRHSLHRVLIFNCTGGRSEATLLAVIKESILLTGNSAFFDHVIFCTNVAYANGNFKRGAWQSTFLILTFF